MGAIRVSFGGFGEGIVISSISGPSCGLLAGRGGNIGLPPRHAERRQSVSRALGRSRAHTLAVASPVDYSPMCAVVPPRRKECLRSGVPLITWLGPLSG